MKIVRIGVLTSLLSVSSIAASAIYARDRIYTADQSSNTVTVIDPSTDSAIGTIALGDVRLSNVLNPQYLNAINVHGLAFSRDARYIAAVSVGSNTVTVIRTADNKIISTTYVGRASHECSFTFDNRTIFVADRGTSYVDILDGLEGGVVGRIKTADGPSKIVMSPDGKLGYVNHIKAPLISIIDVRAQKVVRTIPGLADSFSSDFMISGDGTSLWVPHKKAGVTSIVDLVTERVIDVLVTGPNTNHPNFIMGQDGSIITYLTVGGMNMTNVYRQRNSGDRPILVTQIPSSGVEPHGIWPSPDGERIYYVNERSDTVDVVDTRSHRVIKTIRVGQEGQALIYVPDAIPLLSASPTDPPSLPILDSKTVPGTQGLGTQGLYKRIQTSKIKIQDPKANINASALITVRALTGLDMIQITASDLRDINYTVFAMNSVLGKEVPIVRFVPGEQASNVTRVKAGCFNAGQVLAFFAFYGVYNIDEITLVPSDATPLPLNLSSSSSSHSSMAMAMAMEMVGAGAGAREKQGGVSTTGDGRQVCKVIDPTRVTMPWINSNAAHLQIYDPGFYTCTDNFLCPLVAPLKCGYSCYSKDMYSCKDGKLSMLKV